jgi:ATP-binding cassette subfamily F protein 2
VPRYGLLGLNGSGKTNFLQCLASREVRTAERLRGDGGALCQGCVGSLPSLPPLRQVPIPNHMDLYHLREEAEPSDRTALEAVVDHIKEEMARLNVRYVPPDTHGTVHSLTRPAPPPPSRRWRRRS